MILLHGVDNCLATTNTEEQREHTRQSRSSPCQQGEEDCHHHDLWHWDWHDCTKVPSHSQRGDTDKQCEVEYFHPHLRCPRHSHDSQGKRSPWSKTDKFSTQNTLFEKIEM